jgi:hypothetical protein
VPQHSLTSGRDERGTRYQADFAFRENGQPGLELVRYFDPARKEPGAFGNGWHLLVPYRIEAADPERREFLNATIPARMAVENLLTGHREVLTFSTDRYSIAGYVPDALDSSQIVGLFLMSDASYRLADKIGNEFWFNQAGWLTDMWFSESQHVRIEYQQEFEPDLFQTSPYRIQPATEERVDLLNARVPKQMRVDDPSHQHSEVLILGERDGVVGYVPADGAASRFQLLALLSDGSFRLLDRRGHEFAFDSTGSFISLASPLEPVVRRVSHGSQTARFTYALSPSGHPVVVETAFSTGETTGQPGHVVRYEYDAEGRLARVGGRPELAAGRAPERWHAALTAARPAAERSSQTGSPADAPAWHRRGARVP